jgi:fido (protein-threonine AMPylation protein)
LGLRDPARVDAAEATLVSFRDAALAHDILPGEYGLEHLKAFHRYLFQDLYDWAGETRSRLRPAGGSPGPAYGVRSTRRRAVAA